MLAVFVLIAFGIEQWIESTVLVPFLLGRQLICTLWSSLSA